MSQVELARRRAEQEKDEAAYIQIAALAGIRYDESFIFKEINYICGRIFYRINSYCSII